MHVPQQLPAFALRKRFALTSLAVITAIAIGLGWLMSHMLTERMLQREGEVSMDFIRNLLSTDDSAAYLERPQDPTLRQRFLGSMAHIASMSEPVRANAYQSDGRVVWSTDASLIGRTYPVNDELDEALQGQLVVHSGRLTGGTLDKDEHEGLDQRARYFVESYIPILSRDGGRVVGVMELYKVPVALNAAIRDALLQLWAACAASALVLFTTLFWIVARADRLLQRQQQMLAERQTLATAVDLAQAVAHNLRNPLASIRSSAEMLQASAPSDAESAEHCADITASVDRADRWISELVRVSQAPQLRLEDVQPRAVCVECLAEMAPEMERRRITASLQDGQPPAVRAHTAMLRQILISLLANAIDAMPQGGNVSIGWDQSDSALVLHVTDSGTGFDDQVRGALFRPFFSTKSGGLGIGLALVKRMVEQWSGSVVLGDAPQRGARVSLTLRLASGAALASGTLAPLSGND